MKEEFDLFNLSSEDFITNEPKKETNNVYKPAPTMASDSVYRAVVRFISNNVNPRKSTIKKYSYWLQGPDGKGFYVDCPSSINEKSPIQDTFWKLYKSESAFDKKQAEKLKRKEYYYSYVYIVKDFIRPELDGTVQIMRYPRQIKKLVDAQLSPEIDDIEMGVEPNNIFDFFAGKDFSLKVTLKGGYWNYEESKFAAKSGPIKIDGVVMDNNPESRATIMKLYDNVNSLMEHDFRPWTDDIQSRVNDYLAELTGNPGASLNKVTSHTKKESQPALNADNKQLAKAESQNTTESSGDIDDWLSEFNIGGETTK